MIWTRQRSVAIVRKQIYTLPNIENATKLKQSKNHKENEVVKEIFMLVAKKETIYTERMSHYTAQHWKCQAIEALTNKQRGRE